MPLVLEAATGEKDGEVVVIVRGRVAKVARVQNCGAIEEGVVPFLAPFHLLEELAEDLDLGLLDQGQLFELRRILAMMGSVVMAEIDAGDIGTLLCAEPE